MSTSTTDFHALTTFSGGKSEGLSDRTPPVRYISGKTYNFSQGFSCAFRQWKADSHCSKIHGYAMQFELNFGSRGLDACHWVVDFGGLKEVKEFLASTFDHTYLAAKDDPELPLFRMMHEHGIIDLRVFDHVGCEAFAEVVFRRVYLWLEVYRRKVVNDSLYLHQVIVREHDGNYAGVVNAA